MTNSQLTLVIVLHVVLYTVVLFTSFYALGDKLDKEHPFALDESARCMILFGIPAIGFAALMCNGEAMEHYLNANVSIKAFPYVLFGAMGVLIILGPILYYYVVPARWVLPLGIAGWITTFSWTFWYFWFGPGVFGHH